MRDLHVVKSEDWCFPQSFAERAVPAAHAKQAYFKRLTIAALLGSIACGSLPIFGGF